MSKACAQTAWTAAKRSSALIIVVALSLLLIGCQSSVGQVELVESVRVTESADSAPIAAVEPQASNTPRPTRQIPATMTVKPTSTSSPTPTHTPTATPTATPTPIGPCSDRMPDDDLLTLVTLEYGLSRDYIPGDLVPLADALPVSVTLGYPNKVRKIAREPLVRMVDDMLANDLQPTIISAYRSYSAQSIAWSKWLTNEPERASILSAPPGHSEHQLGTTVDFGSPELAEIVNDEEIEFHTYFYKTREGQWLAEHAHEYGFTLSYPREAQSLTGFFYEPWHYRYVGVELASQLKQQAISLTQYLLENHPSPCIPQR